MKKKLKGGIETIIATVILVGIVVALIWVTVLPIASQSRSLTTSGTGALTDLGKTIRPE